NYPSELIRKEVFEIAILTRQEGDKTRGTSIEVPLVIFVGQQCLRVLFLYLYFIQLTVSIYF
ncbi:hypothetical protein, partial [Acinetobacter sp. YH12069]|uniref:hypothetical protein n=1 Tax=Acinetobacter sp. YH12069 TaxID=2601065 RepID=UPI001C55451F